MLRGAIVIVYIYDSPCFAWMLHYTWGTVGSIV